MLYKELHRDSRDASRESRDSTESRDFERPPVSLARPDGNNLVGWRHSSCLLFLVVIAVATVTLLAREHGVGLTERGAATAALERVAKLKLRVDILTMERDVARRSERDQAQAAKRSVDILTAERDVARSERDQALAAKRSERDHALPTVVRGQKKKTTLKHALNDSTRASANGAALTTTVIDADRGAETTCCDGNGMLPFLPHRDRQQDMVRSLCDAFATLCKRFNGQRVTDRDAKPPQAPHGSLAVSLVMGMLTPAGNSGVGVRAVHRCAWLHKSGCVVQRREGSSEHDLPRGKMLLRFVVDELATDVTPQSTRIVASSAASVATDLAAEISAHADIEILGSDSCSQLRTKPLCWLRHAASKWVHATFIAKADADTIIYPCALMGALQKAALHSRSPQVYYGHHIMFKGCRTPILEGSSRDAPPHLVGGVTCYAQGGLYAVTTSIAAWVGASAFVGRHHPADYAFEDIAMGAWVRAYGEETARDVRYVGEAPDTRYRDRTLQKLGKPHLPWLHLNLGSGGNVTHMVGSDWCQGTYSSYGCCERGFETEKHCPRLESQACRKHPLESRVVAGCNNMTWPFVL